VQVICVPELTTGEAQTEPPTDTVAPERNPVPVRVTGVPPALGPEEGEMLETVGAAAGGIEVLPGAPPPQLANSVARDKTSAGTMR